MRRIIRPGQGKDYHIDPESESINRRESVLAQLAGSVVSVAETGYRDPWNCRVMVSSPAWQSMAGQSPGRGAAMLIRGLVMQTTSVPESDLPCPSAGGKTLAGRPAMAPAARLAPAQDDPSAPHPCQPPAPGSTLRRSDCALATGVSAASRHVAPIFDRRTTT